LKKAYVELHLAVFLFGFTAILGALIQMHTIHLVWWRVLLASLSLWIFFGIHKRLKSIPRKYILIFLGIGVIVGLHWLTFFGAIKASNASITLVCMATGSLFTSFLEPLILRNRIQWFEPIFGVMVIPGMALIVNQTELSMMNGIYLGLTSAFLAAMFSILNKKYIKSADETTITCLEMSSAFVFISILIPFLSVELDGFSIIPTGTDWFYLIILSMVCTTFAYVIAMKALHHLSAFASNLVINLEPVYGILLAWLILKENKELSPGFYAGVFIILLAVFVYPILKKRLSKI
jgi:drug/metabolite transporter (DMT)-like permease